MVKQFIVIDHLIILVIFLLKCSNCYRNYSLENSQICKSSFLDKLNPINTKNIIYLEKHGRNSAVSVKQIWDSNNFYIPEYNCEFKVDTGDKKRIGIYAVIQKMKLRQNSKTQTCIDYIKFRYSNKEYSHQICGNIGIGIKQVYTIDEPSGNLKIYVYVNRSIPLLPKEYLALHIVFTAYTECGDDSSEEEVEEITCNTENKFNSCIARILKNDGIINCPEPNCEDEPSCLDLYIPKPPSTSNIALSGITSLILTMTAVVTCVWMFCKYRECIGLCSRENRRRNRENIASNAQIQSASSTQTGGQASAPTYPGPPSDNKDLPPSYDSLFPETDIPNNLSNR